MTLDVLTGEQTLLRRAELVSVYREAFTGPPWHESEEAVGAFHDRLTADAGRAGFRAVLATGDAGPCGFGTAWPTTSPFPTERSYGKVLAALGQDGTAHHLVGALEVDELAVAPHARGQGLAGRILDLLCDQRRSWLLTSPKAPDAIRLYERSGWRRVVDDPEVVVFVKPGQASP
ncbi:GNAT family N-acetyltransferase [Nonomuraea dietziae]|uniref:GNAT superfamily N-acetyltransferase n=1 Tax=Nonomuraea dietziae TaxID=65515 RepID=A0A7W5YQ77_9ACTN|nr:GNAT family N-acetyltransferase [Nonomuraea dietziae]MBB3726009.1 GNAT superfamily N-acetyltransferase [Nonomuraea dietziae]